MKADIHARQTSYLKYESNTIVLCSFQMAFYSSQKSQEKTDEYWFISASYFFSACKLLWVESHQTVVNHYSPNLPIFTTLSKVFFLFSSHFFIWYNFTKSYVGPTLLAFVQLAFNVLCVPKSPCLIFTVRCQIKKYRYCFYDNCMKALRMKTLGTDWPGTLFLTHSML